MTHRASYIIGILASVMSMTAPGTASALLLDFLSQPLTVGANSISITTDGVTATVQGYHVEFSNGTSTIYGPFTTGTVNGHQVFGTNTSGVGNPGLGLLTAENQGQSDPDAFPGVIQPGFDNLADSPFVPPDVLPSIQFALFSFSDPLDVSQVIVDDVSNFDRDIWVAGGSSAPNLSLDLLNAFSGFTIINSADDASDGVFVHAFAPLSDITFLAVGTALPQTVGDLGPFAAGQPTGGSQFYINAVSFEISQNGDGDGNGDGGDGNGGTPVPQPATGSLLGLGLAVTVAWRRHMLLERAKVCLRHSARRPRTGQPRGA